jgi:hypothetical protein
LARGNGWSEPLPKRPARRSPARRGDLSGASRVLMGGPVMARDSHHRPAIPPQKMNATLTK